MPASSAAFLNGVPELLILRLLADKEMYGYELVEAIRAATGEEIAFAEGVIYPLLHVLERDGALVSRRQTVGGRNRVYYSVTPAGAGRYRELAAQWRKLNRAIAAALAEPRHV